jgi:HEAT repeat protein
MPERRRAGRRVAGILGCAAILAAIVMGVKYGFPGAKRGGSGSAGSTAAALDERTPLADLGEAARNSDPRVLAVIQRRLTPASGAPRTAYTEDEAKGWLQVLLGLRTGYLGFNATGRGVAVSAACRIFEGFAIEPAPPQWIEALPPLHDLLNASMGDSEPNLRAAALDEVARLWVWLPARPITPAEESSLARWKEQVYRPVIRCLGQRDALTIVKAIACLGALPVDNAAAPALAYIDNADPDIRKQTLISFSRRNLLLTEDLLLTRLHDTDPIIRDAANGILKLRGMSQEQISLGRLIFSPSPQQRISVISLLKGRTDVDPAIWLIQLSRDPEEMVRISAVEAMSSLPSTAVRRRLQEMTRSDRSETVRKAAGKLTPSVRENTASLPPLPGSPSLNPKAN